MKLNEKLIKLRKERGLSQEKLGFSINVTRQTISKWELGQTSPDLSKLIEISKYFNIDINVLTDDNYSLTQNLINENEIKDLSYLKNTKIDSIVDLKDFDKSLKKSSTLIYIINRDN